MKKTVAASVVLALCLTAFGESDAEKHHSDGFNTAHEVSVAIRNDGGVKIVFIGNSITLHAPKPSIGWTNNWGMAASAAERDFVHLVMRGIERHEGRKAEVRVRNLAGFELHFETYDFSRIDDLVAFDPDYLIVALGENVRNLDGEAKYRYYAAFKRLLTRFAEDGRHPKVIVRGVFWRNAEKDFAMSCAAGEAGAAFVKADFGGRPDMCATGLFAHSGVAAHPGDAGMNEISRRILEAVFKDAEEAKEASK